MTKNSGASHTQPPTVVAPLLSWRCNCTTRISHVHCITWEKSMSGSLVADDFLTNKKSFIISIGILEKPACANLNTTGAIVMWTLSTQQPVHFCCYNGELIVKKLIHTWHAEVTREHRRILQLIWYTTITMAVCTNNNQLCGNEIWQIFGDIAKNMWWR